MSVDTTTKVLVVSARLISVMRDGCDQGDYDGRGQQSGKCNFVHFYIEARPPMLITCVKLGLHAHG